jgi:hypothetical protein
MAERPGSRDAEKCLRLNAFGVALSTVELLAAFHAVPGPEANFCQKGIKSRTTSTPDPVTLLASAVKKSHSMRRLAPFKAHDQQQEVKILFSQHMRK